VSSDKKIHFVMAITSFGSDFTHGSFVSEARIATSREALQRITQENLTPPYEDAYSAAEFEPSADVVGQNRVHRGRRYNRSVRLQNAMLSDLQLFDSSIVCGSNARISAKFRTLLFLCEQAWPPNDICELEYYMRSYLRVCIR
jgi:hypothetical protein